MTRTIPKTSSARITANLLGIPFGISGLAQCWSLAHAAAVVPRWPADVLWGLTALLWAVLAGAYVWNVGASHRLRSDLIDPTFAPFISLLFIVPMLVGVAWSDAYDTLGRTMFWVAFALTITFGGWISGQWILEDLRLAQWHPGYFLPTVAGGLVAAGGCAALGYHRLAQVMFGYGAICWLALGSILLARLFIETALPPALVPTMAIEVAPPVVAGSAWFQINGNREDVVVLLLAGYALLMVLVQVRLLPVYVRLRFSPGWWAFSFSYASAVAFAIRWAGVSQAAYQRPLTVTLLSLITIGISGLIVRTAAGMVRSDFLPRTMPESGPSKAPAAQSVFGLWDSTDASVGSPEER